MKFCMRQNQCRLPIGSQNINWFVAHNVGAIQKCRRSMTCHRAITSSGHSCRDQSFRIERSASFNTNTWHHFIEETICTRCSPRMSRMSVGQNNVTTNELMGSDCKRAQNIRSKSSHAQLWGTAHILRNITDLVWRSSRKPKPKPTRSPKPYGGVVAPSSCTSPTVRHPSR